MADTYISAQEAARRTGLSTGALAKRRYLKKAPQRLDLHRRYAPGPVLRRQGAHGYSLVRRRRLYGLTLKECIPAYVIACVRTFKALLQHAVKRRVIAASPLTEKIKFEGVLLPELELNDAERVAFLGAFDDEAAQMRNAASASVNWTLAFQRSSAVQSAMLVRRM